MTYTCDRCKVVDVLDYEPEYCCCSGININCGCMGKPIEPPLCDKCWDAIMGESRGTRG